MPGHWSFRRVAVALAIFASVWLLSASQAQAQFRGPNPLFPTVTFPPAPMVPILNNGSLHTAMNPGATKPGQLAFSNIAAIPQDLRLVCNGIPVSTTRIAVALDGKPGASGTPLIIPQGPNVPPLVINVGFGVSAPTATVGVRPWWPLDDVAYQICGWGASRSPRTSYPNPAASMLTGASFMNSQMNSGNYPFFSSMGDSSYRDDNPFSSFDKKSDSDSKDSTDAKKDSTDPKKGPTEEGSK
jgi:hypothetical protein